MLDWADGYIKDVTYPANFYRQTTPVWITIATLLAGHRPPSITGKFRWCDLGCGQASTALGVAACYPDAEIFAFDFNPTHIDNARTLAAAAGLTNIVLEETAFQTLAAALPGTYPKMDFIVLHGIWSWISAAQRGHVLGFIANHLAPGGIVYVSYNALAGWAPMLPMQRLFRSLSETRGGSSVASMAAGFDLARDLSTRGARFFKDNPAVAAQLEALAKLDPNYLPHELLHASWEPTTFDTVSRDLETAKCGFIGSATLLENIDSFSTPVAVAELLNQFDDVRIRESLRDLGAGRIFRRDLYRRGADKPPAGEIAALLDHFQLLEMFSNHDGDLKITTYGVEPIALDMEIYAPLVQRLRSSPLAISEIRRAVGESGLLHEIVSVVIAAGIALPIPNVKPSARQCATTQSLNHAISQHNSQGGAIHFQLSPRLGLAINAGGIETIIIEMLTHEPKLGVADLASRLMDRFAHAGQALLEDGAPIKDPERILAGWHQIADTFVSNRLPLFQRTGILH